MRFNITKIGNKGKGEIAIARELEQIKIEPAKKREEKKMAKELMKTISPFSIGKSTSLKDLSLLREKEEKEIAMRKLIEIKEGTLAPLVDLSKPEEDHMEIVETFSINEPYSFARILFDDKNHEYIYQVVEPKLNEKERKILDFIKETLIKTLDMEIGEFDRKEAKDFLKKRVDRVISDYSIDIEPIQKKKILYYIMRDFIGYGKIDVLMIDPLIEDISCDKAVTPIYLYHRSYESIKTNVSFEDDNELDSFVVKLAQRCGKSISIAEPMLDATMPDGSRLQTSLSKEVTTRGSTFTIRRFREEPFTPPDLVDYNTMSPEMAAYFWMAVENGASAIFGGGTASGKTTTLNALSLFIPPQMKIVSIEDTREINLPHPNWIASLTREGVAELGSTGGIDMFELLKSALRQRPEYILLGEVRGREAFVLFQAMATGHTVYSTMHADSIHSVVHRLEGRPIEIPRIMLQSLDIVAIQVLTRIKKKRARRMKQVVEVVEMDPRTKELLTNEVFAWIPSNDSFSYSGKSYLFDKIAIRRSMSEEGVEEEWKMRKEVIKWMRKKGHRNYIDVANIVSDYYREPEEFIKRIRKDMKENVK